jgi:hypothetical protein
MSWTLCTSGAAISKAGANANSSIVASGSILAVWSDEAEAKLNTDSRYDWVANYASVGANYKPILAKAVSDSVALNIIGYDPSGFTSRYEAQFMADMLVDDYNKCIALLSEKDVQEVMI